MTRKKVFGVFPVYKLIPIMVIPTTRINKNITAITSSLFPPSRKTNTSKLGGDTSFLHKPSIIVGDRSEFNDEEFMYCLLHKMNFGERDPCIALIIEEDQ